MAEKFEAYAIVELFGHQRCAGRISEQAIGGETFIRVDIPRKDGAMYTRLFGKGAIYCINICEEATARSFASEMYEPLRPYTALPAPAPALEAAGQMAERLGVPVSTGAPDRDDDVDYDDDDDDVPL